jgi:ferredoxin
MTHRDDSEHTLSVLDGETAHRLSVPHGANLRRVLLEAGLSPYAALTRQANCGGRGLCATCGVWIDDAPEPVHWHDRLAERFGYARLSCQVTVERDMVVRLDGEKRVWGARRAG